MVALMVSVVATGAAATPITLDFETDQFGSPLGNGQIIDTEFTLPIAISSPGTGTTHLGLTIFDSTPGGPNSAGVDQDLLVDLGNILILQDTAFPGSDGSFFFEPNDEADFDPIGFGTFLFDFAAPVELLSIDLIDINGGSLVDLVLTDGASNTRTYNVPHKWTHDVVFAPLGWDTLDLTDLNPQLGEGGSVATGFDTGPFDPQDVGSLSITFSGSSPSGGIDNLIYVPEPCTILLLTGGVLCMPRRRTRTRSS